MGTNHINFFLQKFYNGGPSKFTKLILKYYIQKLLPILIGTGTIQVHLTHYYD